MADVDYVEFGAMTIAIGDGADPESFLPKCSLNSSRGFSVNGETTSRTVPDCDDDLKAASVLNYITSVGGEISGSGVLNKGEDKEFFDWLKSGVAKNIKVSTGGTGGTIYTLAAKCSSFNVSSESKDVCNVEITLVSHGEISAAVVT